jgi:acyl carrier protein
MTDRPDRAESLNQVRDFLVNERGIAPERVTEDASLEDLQLDSLALTELGFGLFVSHGVPLDDDAVLTARTVGDVLDALCGKSPERSRSVRAQQSGVEET